MANAMLSWLGSIGESKQTVSLSIGKENKLRCSYKQQFLNYETIREDFSKPHLNLEVKENIMKLVIQHIILLHQFKWQGLEAGPFHVSPSDLGVLLHSSM